jgi:glutathione S-transferase
MSILYYTLNNSVFTNFAFYSTASVVKMMGFSALTALKRLSKDVFANPEDLSLAKNKSAVVTLNDPDVERIRRNHLNDIENIVPFVLVGLFYVGTNPDRDVALWHFRVFLVSRVLHTLAYQLALPQPSRFIACAVGYLTTLSMAVRVFLTVRP